MSYYFLRGFRSYYYEWKDAEEELEKAKQRIAELETEIEKLKAKEERQ